MNKLSALSDVEIEKFLNSIDIDIDTDGEEELEEDLTDDVCEAARPVNEEDEEAIEKVIHMSDSMLAREICVTSSGSPTPFAKLLSPSSSIASNSPQSQKRKRKAPAEQNIALQGFYRPRSFIQNTAARESLQLEVSVSSDAPTLICG